MPFISSVRGTFGSTSKSKRGLNSESIASAMQGGSVTTAGGYRIHTYTAAGAATFTNGLAIPVEILMIAGGGGGGSIGGGGGAGGYIYGTSNFGSGTFPLNVGAGGNASGTSHGPNVVGTQGGNTTGFGLTAIGGGFGCGWSTWSGNSGSGGSTGGGTGPTNASAALQPSQPAVAGITQVGHRGANGGEDGASDGEPGMSGNPNHQGGGGGGAGARAFGRGGGLGISSSITGTSVGRGGGGGGGVHGGAANNQWSPSYSTVGIPFGGGVGAGQNDQNPSGKNGLANTGGGGGGMHHPADNPTGAGGSGIIVIRYQSSPNSL